jgi:hypothetical protein
MAALAPPDGQMIGFGSVCPVKPLCRWRKSVASAQKTELEGAQLTARIPALGHGVVSDYLAGGLLVGRLEDCNASVGRAEGRARQDQHPVRKEAAEPVGVGRESRSLVVGHGRSEVLPWGMQEVNPFGHALSMLVSNRASQSVAALCWPLPPDGQMIGFGGACPVKPLRGSSTGVAALRVTAHPLRHVSAKGARAEVARPRWSAEVVEVAGETGERKVEREDPFGAVRELVRLARRCVNPFEDGEESSYTQVEALHDLEEWLRERIERR